MLIVKFEVELRGRVLGMRFRFRVRHDIIKTLQDHSKYSALLPECLVPSPSNPETSGVLRVCVVPEEGKARGSAG